MREWRKSEGGQSSLFSIFILKLTNDWYLSDPPFSIENNIIHWTLLPEKKIPDLRIVLE